MPKLGRKPPKRGLPKLMLRHYIDLSQLPPIPDTFDFSGGAPKSLASVYMNDVLSCCVISGGYHYLGVATGGAGAEFVATDDQIVTDYSAIGGYKPGDDSTDQGCDEQTALNYWTNTGFASGDRLLAWLCIDPNNDELCHAAGYLFESLYFGAGLPDTWITPFPSAPGFVWDAGTSVAANGHCFMSVGENDQGNIIDTWALLGTLTTAARKKNIDECYILLSQAAIDKATQKAPNGIDWDAIKADWDQLGGSV